MLKVAAVHHHLAAAIAATAVMSLSYEAAATPTAASPVQVQMRNVDLRVDADTILGIHWLRGELISTRQGEPPIFDDKNSFIVRLDQAEVAITVESLSHLLNRYVFNYDGSPFRQMQVETDGDHLRMKGKLHKGISVPFSVVADARVDPRGRLRLHTTSIKALGIPATRLFALFRVELGSLVHLQRARGVELSGNDIVLDPAALVPPPHIEGRLQAIRVEPGRIVQLFGPGRAAPLHPKDGNAPNYMYYRGGVLKFGKLTMTDADLELIDESPSDPFDFFQDRYNEQLVAGYSKNTPDLGLKVYMPDYHRLHDHHSQR